METHLIVDGMNLLYQAHYGSPPLTTSQGHRSGALYGFMQILRRIIIAENPDFVAVCWDGEPVYRRKIFSEYKQQRDHSDMDMQEFNAQATAAMEFIRALGVPQARHLELEADDLIAAYAMAISDLYPKECHVLIASADKDFWQLVSKSVSCLNPRTDSRTTLKNFKGRSGFNTVSDYLEYKVIVGDVSDNIPGLLKGVGDKRARAMVEEQNYAKNWSSELLDAKTIGLQYDLIDLPRMMYKIKYEVISIMSGMLVVDFVPSKVFRDACSRWEFYSMNHDGWLLPFKTLYDKAKERTCFRTTKGQRGITHFKKALLRAIKNHA